MVSFYIQKLGQLVHRKRLWPHVLSSVGLSPVLLAEAGKGLLVELCLRCFEALQKVLVVLQDLCVSIVLCLDSRFVCLNLGISALDPGPA